VRMSISPFAGKLRLIYAPFLLLSLGVTAVCTLLNWLLVVCTGLIFSIPELLVMLWFPFIVSGVAAMIFLKPRIKLLDFERDSTAGSYRFMAMLLIMAPAILAQRYLVIATGELTALGSIAGIAEHPPSRYYSIQDYHIDKNIVGVHADAVPAGKYDEDLEYRLYFAVPIFDVPSDTLDSNVAAWMGVDYMWTISNRTSEEEKREKWRQFSHESYARFDAADLRQFVYLEQVGVTEDRDGYMKAVAACSRYRSGDEVPVLLPVDEPFEARGGGALTAAVAAFGISALVMFLFIAFPSLKEDELQRSHIPVAVGAAAFRREFSEVFEALLPRKGYVATPLLAGANIAMLIIMVCTGLEVFRSFPAKELLTWGANFGPLTTGGEWWRLLTSMFVHGSTLHMLVNMFGLALAGPFLEKIIGWWRVLLIYLVSGILSGLASIWFNGAAISVGASGAIFGLYGTVLILALAKVVSWQFDSGFVAVLVLFAGINIVIGFAPGSNIDNAAHISGLVAGMAMGGILMPRYGSR